MVSEQTYRRAFFGVSALLFVTSAAVTIHWCRSMWAMGETRLGRLTALVGVAARPAPWPESVSRGASVLCSSGQVC